MDILQYLFRFYWPPFYLLSLCLFSTMYILIYNFTTNVLKAMRYFLYASCTATFVSLTLAFGTQTRNIDNENSMGLLCDGFCKFLGPTFCATCYKAYATSVLTVNLINLHTLYYRTVCLKLINAQEIGRNTLIFSWHYLFIIAYLTSTLIPPSDHLAVYNETLAHYPEYDYTPYLNFGGFSQAQKVYLDNSTVAMFLVTLYFPMIGSYWKHQAMKLLKPHVSPNTSDATRVMFRKMIIGLNFQIFLPMLSYIPVVFLFILIQVTGHQFLISQYTITCLGALPCFLDPIFQIYFITPYRNAVRAFFVRKPSADGSWATRVSAVNSVA